MTNDQNFTEEATIRAPKPDADATPAAPQKEEPSIQAPKPDTEASPAAPQEASVRVEQTCTSGPASESDRGGSVPGRDPETMPATALAVLRHAALLPGESPEEYEELRAAIRAAKKPVDVIEEIFAAEVAEWTWEAFRDSRLGTTRLKAWAFEKITEKCRFPDEKAARRFWMEKPEAGRVAEQRLSNQFTLSELFAETLCQHLDEVDRMLRVRLGKLARRDASLREFDRHRLVASAFGPVHEQECTGAKALEQKPHAEAPYAEGTLVDAETGSILAEETGAKKEAEDGK